MKALPRRHQNFAPSPFLRSGKVATATSSPGVNTNPPGVNYGMPTDPAFMRISSPDISQSKTKNKGIMLYDSQHADVELTQADNRKRSNNNQSLQNNSGVWTTWDSGLKEKKNKTFLKCTTTTNLIKKEAGKHKFKPTSSRITALQQPATTTIVSTSPTLISRLTLGLCDLNRFKDGSSAKRASSRFPGST
ncbi:hypothetical protein G4B88_022149 [Cannabis sativa]|uniref:Uncharacterized protein n=1 Tax=Cannabis sativa TaxID=3483 RepID=A0A7J6DLF8_CANSA|nr:hypothetical protein G4B88_022149 [Cannabis sativa]